ncbi:MAG: methylase [Marmoricola sp.]|nr:methylase [Marmoricola sp.]
MSNMDRMPEDIVVGRSDPVYMAHAYLTKVPVPAITPFIEAFCPEGGVVADPFAGSGMTGVAAVATGRSARLSDISVLGRHIGSNYLNLVDPELLQSTAATVVKEASSELQGIYAVPCEACGEEASLSKTVWSVLVECGGCARPVNFYRALETADWSKAGMQCSDCGASVSSKNRRVGEAPVVDCISCPCSPKQREQAARPIRAQDTEGLDFPEVEITPDREMYRASALGKSGNNTVASFYSPRNLRALVALRSAIRDVSDEQLASKLLFAFTGTLTRASKRYQWSKARPLNAANANYYIAPVFYEWNVFELFQRKAVAVTRSDDFVRSERVARGHGDIAVDAEYVVESAAELSLADDSVDYIFTDPPFGSNLFYADMALFQEGWLDGFTDVTKEAVIDRSRGTKRSSERYEQLLTDALSECRRVLKPGGRLSMVFGNSSGKIWALVQRAVAAAGLVIEPEHIVILNKGQRSVKGLASGFEHVATLDLVLTMRESDAVVPELTNPSYEQLVALTREVAAGGATTPSHLYLALLRSALGDGWSVAELDLRTVTETLLADGWAIDSRSGRLTRPDAA